jgi:hypothetical protein
MPWTVVTDVLDTAEDEWTTVLGATTLNAQAKGWRIKPMVLSPNANVRDSFLGWGAFAPEEYNVRPEDDAVRPEQSQDDADGWTIVAEPV